MTEVKNSCNCSAKGPHGLDCTVFIPYGKNPPKAGTSMNYGKLMMSSIVIIYIVACLAYAITGDYRKAVYNGAAAVLTGSVSFE